MIYPLLPVFLTTVLGASASFIGATYPTRELAFSPAIQLLDRDDRHLRIVAVVERRPNAVGEVLKAGRGSIGDVEPDVGGRDAQGDRAGVATGRDGAHGIRRSLS